MVSLFGRGFDSHQLHLLLPPAGHSIIPLPPACGRPLFFISTGTRPIFLTFAFPDKTLAQESRCSAFLGHRVEKTAKTAMFL